MARFGMIMDIRTNICLTIMVFALFFTACGGEEPKPEPTTQALAFPGADGGGKFTTGGRGGVVVHVTTLSDDTETTISGIKRLGSGVSVSVLVKPSEFIAKRDEAEDKEITEFALWFYNGAYDAAAKSAFNATPAQGETDDRFAVYFVGTFSIVQNGAGVDEALKATLTIYPQKTPSTGKVMNYERPSHLA